MDKLGREEEEKNERLGSQHKARQEYSSEEMKERKNNGRGQDVKNMGKQG